MAKKNPYVFTIGFDETDLSHVRAAEILNRTKKKAQLIAVAILSYVDGAESSRNSEYNLETLQPVLQQLIQKEIEKRLEEQADTHHLHIVNQEEPNSGQSLDLSSNEEEIPMDESITRNIVDAMDAFRRT